MRVNVVIERVVLDGLPIGSHQGALVGDALRAALARLLADGRLSPQITAGGLIPRLDGGVFAMEQGARADAIGEQLARPIAGALR